jgi:hypothetical protein
MEKPVIDQRSDFIVPKKNELRSMEFKSKRRIERNEKKYLLSKRKTSSIEVQKEIDKQIGRIAGLKGALKRAVTKAKELAYRAKQAEQRLQSKPSYPVAPKYTTAMNGDFYQTKEWRQVRWSVISRADGKCSVCGRSKKDGIVIHVDHIKPRSKYPELELDPSNLQLLCEDCNLGKGAKTQTF